MAKNPKKRHPRLTKALADIKKTQKAHKDLTLALKKVKAHIEGIPYTGIPYDR